MLKIWYRSSPEFKYWMGKCIGPGVNYFIVILSRIPFVAISFFVMQVPTDIGLINNYSSGVE